MAEMTVDSQAMVSSQRPPHSYFDMNNDLDGIPYIGGPHPSDDFFNCEEITPENGYNTYYAKHANYSMVELAHAVMSDEGSDPRTSGSAAGSTGEELYLAGMMVAQTTNAKVLRGLLKGNLAKAAEDNLALKQELHDLASQATKGHPCIYHHSMVDENGNALPKQVMADLLNHALEYCDGDNAELANAVDNVTGRYTVSMEESEQGYRAYPSHEKTKLPIHRRQKAIRRLRREVLLILRDMPEGETHLSWVLSCVGFSNQVQERFKNHRRHKHSTFVLNLLDAILQVMYPDHRYGMKQYVIWLVVDTKYAPFGEMFFARLCRSYVWLGHGMAYQAVGQSNEGVFSSPEKVRQAFREYIVENSPLLVNHARHCGGVRQPSHYDFHRDRCHKDMDARLQHLPFEESGAPMLEAVVDHPGLFRDMLHGLEKAVRAQVQEVLLARKEKEKANPDYLLEQNRWCAHRRHLMPTSVGIEDQVPLDSLLTTIQVLEKRKRERERALAEPHSPRVGTSNQAPGPFERLSQPPTSDSDASSSQDGMEEPAEPEFERLSQSPVSVSDAHPSRDNTEEPEASAFTKAFLEVFQDVRDEHITVKEIEQTFDKRMWAYIGKRYGITTKIARHRRRLQMMVLRIARDFAVIDWTELDNIKVTERERRKDLLRFAFSSTGLAAMEWQHRWYLWMLNGKYRRERDRPLLPPLLLLLGYQSYPMILEMLTWEQLLPKGHRKANVTAQPMPGRSWVWEEEWGEEC